MQVASPQGLPLVTDNKEARQEALRLNDSRLSLIEQNTRPETAQTAQAVKPADDIVDVGEEAQNIAKLEEAIANVNRASTGGVLIDALGALEDFLSENSFSDIVKEALAGLSELATRLIDTVSSDPSALDAPIALKLNASFNFQEVASDSFYSRDVSLNVSFSYSDGATAINGALNFNESIRDNGSETFYSRQEEATMVLVTFDADLAKNEALNAFLDVSERITGIDMRAMLEEMQAAQPQLTKSSGIDIAALLTPRSDVIYTQQRIEVQLLEIMLEDSRELKAAIESARERALQSKTTETSAANNNSPAPAQSIAQPQTATA